MKKTLMFAALFGALFAAGCANQPGPKLREAERVSQQTEEDGIAIFNQAVRESLENDLIVAARDGDFSEVQRLLAFGVNPNAMHKNNLAALLAASLNGYAEIAALLLVEGANPNAATDDGVTALMTAANRGHAEVVKVLLSAGANPNAADNNRNTALMFAASSLRAEIIKVLLSAGANPNAADNNRMTALGRVVVQGNVQIAEMLLAAGANPNYPSKHGMREIDFVRYLNQPDMVRLFERYKNGTASADTSAKPSSNTNVAETVFEKVWRTIVVIKNGDNQGSGVIVRPNIVATNCHVLDGGKITVYKHDNRRASTDTLFAATVRKRDSANDFCLLDVSGLGGIPAKIRKYDTLKIGETVYALGSPKGLDLSLSSGLISQLRQGGGERHIQTDAAISPGSSGGGLFDSEGNLIGITTAVHKDADAENIGYAIPADLALNL